MALNGSLAEFSVAEVLQLLALQQKSGVLVLTPQDQKPTALFFERGRILAAADRRRDTRPAFLQYLFDNLLLTRDQLETVEDLSKQTGQDIFTILLTTGLMGRDRLGDEMHRYMQRLVDDMVTWRTGSYEFSGDERSLPHQGNVVKLSPEELLMESMRRKDELATLKDSFIASDHVLAKAPNPPSGPLPRECTVVLSLIDGKRTVEQIAAASPLGEYLTYESVAELLGRQQIIVLDPAHAGLLKSTVANDRIPAAGWAALVAPLLVSLALGAVLGPLIAPRHRSSGWLPERIAEERRALGDQMRIEVIRLRHSLDR